jgi:hypothetical protein
VSNEGQVSILGTPTLKLCDETCGINRLWAGGEYLARFDMNTHNCIESLMCHSKKVSLQVAAGLQCMKHGYETMPRCRGPVWGCSDQHPMPGEGMPQDPPSAVLSPHAPHTRPQCPLVGQQVAAPSRHQSGIPLSGRKMQIWTTNGALLPKVQPTQATLHESACREEVEM